MPWLGRFGDMPSTLQMLKDLQILTGDIDPNNLKGVKL
jgi:hypothetical protein